MLIDQGTGDQFLDLLKPEALRRGDGRSAGSTARFRHAAGLRPLLFLRLRASSTTMSPSTPRRCLAVTLFVDADACPVKAEAERVATRHGIGACCWSPTAACGPRANPLVEMVIVPDGPDVADKWIAERAGQGDVVVTADIPLAARCVEAGARVLRARRRGADAAQYRRRACHARPDGRPARRRPVPAGRRPGVFTRRTAAASSTRWNGCPRREAAAAAAPPAARRAGMHAGRDGPQKMDRHDIEAVVFDIGNVLIEWQPERFYDGVHRAEARGGDVRRGRPARHERRASTAAAISATRSTNCAEAHPGCVRRNPALARPLARDGDAGDPAFACALLRALRRKGVPVFALTNFGVGSLRDWPCTHYPFLDEFDRAFVSGQLRHDQARRPRSTPRVEAESGVAPRRAALHRRPARTTSPPPRRAAGSCTSSPAARAGPTRLVAEGLLTEEEARMTASSSVCRGRGAAGLARPDRGAGGGPRPARAPSIADIFLYREPDTLLNRVGLDRRAGARGEVGDGLSRQPGAGCR